MLLRLNMLVLRSSLLLVLLACSGAAHISEEMWSETAASAVGVDLKLVETSAGSEDEPSGGEDPWVSEQEEDQNQGDQTPGPAPPSPTSPSSSTKDPSCKAEGWCQSPEAAYSQQCTEDAGPVWQDDGQTYPNKHYWEGHPSTPQLPTSGKCPPPLAASCARKGVKAAYMDGPIDCGGKGFFCRIMPQADWVNTEAKPMPGEEASFHLKHFKEANFYHCNTTSKTEAEREQGHPHSQGHCHGGITDDIYGWWSRDHFFRGYAGTLNCCCDYNGATVGLVNSCDVRRPVTQAEQKERQCTDVNEDARAKYMYKGGCTAAHKANFKDPAVAATPGLETCWTVTSFGVGGRPGKTLIENEWSE